MGSIQGVRAHIVHISQEALGYTRQSINQSIAIIGMLEDHAEFHGLQIKYLYRATLIPIDEETIHTYKHKRGEDIAAEEAKDDRTIEGRLFDEEQRWRGV